MSLVLRFIKPIPVIKKRIEREYQGIMKALEGVVKPYRGRSAAFPHIPEDGLEREQILREMEELSSIEESKWRDGFVSGAVYHGADGHIDFLSRVYAINSQSNPLHSDVWPSTTKYEAEVASMTANMLGASEMGPGAGPDERICGVVTSGGTESILLITRRMWPPPERRLAETPS